MSSNKRQLRDSLLFFRFVLVFANVRGLRFTRINLLSVAYINNARSLPEENDGDTSRASKHFKIFCGL